MSEPTSSDRDPDEVGIDEGDDQRVRFGDDYGWTL